MSTTYKPKFHTDGTITYWVDSYGWFHRKNPLLIMPGIVSKWEKKYRDKYRELIK